MRKIARETAGAASTRSSLRPLISGREVSSRTRAVHVARSRTHTQSSSPGLTGRPSIPETPMIEPRSHGVLDPRLRGDDDRVAPQNAFVIASAVRGPDERSDIRGHARSRIPPRSSALQDSPTM